MDFKKLNIATGWTVFLVATWTYIATLEPTASFWDCGEFLATAYKLQVGHPPGAPLFMMLGRVASAFVGPENVPLAINTLSALCSSFTILFLFWSITHMARKLVLRDGKGELTTGQLIAVLGSGVVGSLAYTWSDSFWFSAVEAEVYSMSSFFTAVTFWAILKWESEAEEAHDTRWLILICYLLGLGIGVQLLALLCIPPIALVYYFKKYRTSTKGVVWTLVISALILGAIQAVIIPGVAKVGRWFELLFVNDMGLPFNTGNLVAGVLFIGAMVYGLLWSQRQGRVVVNMIILGVGVILLGYSTYAMTVVRSLANPPIDENNPENVFNLVSYLNREQYGDRPLLLGQFWDSPLADERGDGDPVYTATYQVQKNGRTVKNFYDGWSADHFMEANPGHTVKHAYIITDARKATEPIYEPEFTMLFPRMYSSQASHKQEYKLWSKFKGTPVRTTDREGKPTIIHKPTQAENIRFFMDYQVNWMYWRYFMWNFAGRQNDIQGHGNILEGNWLSGINWVDQQRLGTQEGLPPSMTANKGYNKLYFLPLLLGMIGFIFQLLRHLRDWTVVMLLFFFTGLAIVIYLNQYPLQPRERDYAYVGSFYAFAIWIGLGVVALYEAARSITLTDLGKAIGAAIGVGVLKYLAELIGDNDHSVSFALFAMALMAAAALGLMHGLGRVLRNDSGPATVATLLGLAVPAVMVRAEWDDHDRSGRTLAPDLARNYLESCAPNAILFTNGDNDTFPLWYAQEVEGIRTDVRVVNLSLLNTDWYIDQMRRKAYESDPVPFGLAPEKYRQGTRDVVALLPREKGGGYMDLRKAIAFASDDRNMQPLFSRTQKDAYMPTDKFRLPVDSAFVFGPEGLLTAKDTANWVPEVRWQLRKQYVMKNHFMVLDLLANNNWKRPVHFAVTTGPDSYLNLQDHFRLEGLTYRLVPVFSPQRTPGSYGSVGTDVMLDNVMNKFRWGNMDTEGFIYMQENDLRMTTNLRLQIATLASALAKEGRKDDGKKVLDLCLEKMPERNVPYDRIMLPVTEAYYDVGDKQRAGEISGRLFQIMDENLSYYLTLDPAMADKISQEMEITHAVMGRLVQNLERNDPSNAQLAQLKARMAEVDAAYEAMLESIETAGRRNIRMSF
ncbi:MAG: DUF2723 domain-containing protein [Flavobacteriales bacterium]|nr:DUF2723 domain-containing protein [Flavobacteriales bacterium]